jgi:chemotaxis response regulator CheB
MVGSGKTSGLMTVQREIRNRIGFTVDNVRETRVGAEKPFDLVICRNVLIYFDPEAIESIIDSFIARIHPSGLLITGHSEFFRHETKPIERLGNTTYRVIDRSGKLHVSDLPAVARKVSKQKSAELFAPDAILIGASTGGTEALSELLKKMPHPCPPVVVVQHMAPAYSEAFYKRLAATSGMAVGAANEGAPLRDNHLYMATGDQHIGIKQVGKQLTLEFSTLPPVNRHRPSVDYLFQAAARTSARYLVILLTGMGQDGAAGMLELYRRGATTMAQDEASSVVFGMPRAAIEMKAVRFVGNLQELRQMIEKSVSSRTGKSAA